MKKENGTAEIIVAKNRPPFKPLLEVKDLKSRKGENLMSDTMNLFNGLVFGTILSSADKMGINPMLIGRQSAKILAPMIDGLAQQFLGLPAPKNMEELLKELEILGKNFGVLGKEFELNYTENKIELKVVECPWKEMSKYGKSIGYKACPLCVIEIMLMGAIEGAGLSQIFGFNLENSEATCKIEAALEQK